MKTGLMLAYLFVVGLILGVGNLHPLAAYAVGMLFSACALTFGNNLSQKNCLDKPRPNTVQ